MYNPYNDPSRWKDPTKMLPPFQLETNVFLVGHKDYPMDLSKGALAHTNTFKTVQEWRDRVFLQVKEPSIGNPETLSINFLLNGNLEKIQFWLVPLYMDCVYFTQHLVTNDEGISLLRAKQEADVPNPTGF